MGGIKQCQQAKSVTHGCSRVIRVTKRSQESHCGFQCTSKPWAKCYNIQPRLAKKSSCFIIELYGRGSAQMCHLSRCLAFAIYLFFCSLSLSPVMERCESRGGREEAGEKGDGFFWMLRNAYISAGAKNSSHRGSCKGQPEPDTISLWSSCLCWFWKMSAMKASNQVYVSD